MRFTTPDGRTRSGVVAPAEHLGWLDERARPSGGDPSAFVCCFAHDAGAKHAAREKAKPYPCVQWEDYLAWVPWREACADAGFAPPALAALRAFQLARLYALVKDAFDVLPFSACKPHAQNVEWWRKARTRGASSSRATRAAL